MVMVEVFLGVLGLSAGSFVNALVWRLRQKELVSEGKGNRKLAKQLFKANSRSMCPYCHHTLSPLDLIPVISWLWLKGKCRYCSKPISAQYPIVELLAAVLFVASFAFWPTDIVGVQIVVFGLWLVALTILVASAVYDLKYMILPTVLMHTLLLVAILMAIINLASSNDASSFLLGVVGAVLVGGGVFYAIFILSGGKWIGGGDIRLGTAIGVLVAAPSKAMLVIFLASLGGTLLALTLMAAKKFKRNMVIPFGPFLIAATIVTVLFGSSIIDWYVSSFLTI